MQKTNSGDGGKENGAHLTHGFSETWSWHSCSVSRVNELYNCEAAMEDKVATHLFAQILSLPGQRQAATDGGQKVQTGGWRDKMGKMESQSQFCIRLTWKVNGAGTDGAMQAHRWQTGMLVGRETSGQSGSNTGESQSHAQILPCCPGKDPDLSWSHAKGDQGAAWKQSHPEAWDDETILFTYNLQWITRKDMSGTIRSLFG